MSKNQTGKRMVDVDLDQNDDPFIGKASFIAIILIDIGIGGHVIGFRMPGSPKADDGVPVDSSIFTFDDFLG